ncbi:MAG: TIM barrel protein [Candidatus Woesearchaeota archaeon]|nr:TIM barrel protein [Candidatus Woesearchaeota archaeon]
METSNYWHSLDRRPIKEGDFALDPLKLGISHGGQVDEGLKVNIFRGAKSVELAFFGTGKGQRGQGGTPESYGHNEREEMRQLARLNEVEISTHAAPDLGPLSGFTGQGFSREQKEQSMHEIRRATEFGAEAAGGGAVVVHIGSRHGELPRALVEADDKFLMYSKEKERMPIQLVNEKTGQLINIPLDHSFIESFVNDKGELDRKTRTFKDLLEDEKERARKVSPTEPIKLANVYGSYTKHQEELMEGERDRFYILAKEERKQFEKLKEMTEEFEEIQKKGQNVDFARKMLRKELQDRGMLPGQERGKLYEEEEVKEYLEKPETFLQRLKEERGKNLRAHEEIAISRDRELYQLKQQTSELRPAQEYVLDEIKDSLARSALHAYDLEKQQHLERPLFISPENWSPESYGSHPKEYKEIIQQSREEMAKRLVEQRGMKQAEARKIAEDHIQGTFDVGHLNFWKKYFTGSDEQFKEWMSKQFSELSKNNIIGNVHIHDNFGYHDEHLSPGEGNVPIEEFVQKLEKSGYTGKYIAEVGGQKEGFHHTSWTGAMNVLNSPVYRVDNQYARWSDIERSYFGSVPQSPGFLVGDMVPSKDWTLWSEVGLE